MRIIRVGWPAVTASVRGAIFQFGLDKLGRLTVFKRNENLAENSKPSFVSQPDWERVCDLAKEALRSCPDRASNKPFDRIEPQEKSDYINNALRRGK
ncbi:MAG: hypothetical protein AAB495_03200 [Patescibacteria group bacterium]